MRVQSFSPPMARSPLAWITVALAGVAAPVVAMLMIVGSPASPPLALVSGPILALGLMGVGIIAAAASGRYSIGMLLALLNGVCLIALAQALGLASLAHPISVGFAVIVASVSFAVRGALFARSAADKGWLIAVFVVAGEAAILITASAVPHSLPDWLLALLPAQWANVAIQTAISGTGTFAASSALLALAGTAAATLLVAQLWPRRWPYAIMFTTWLGLSALVYYWPAPPASAIAETSTELASGK